LRFCDILYSRVGGNIVVAVELREIDEKELLGANPIVSSSWAFLKIENEWRSKAYRVDIDEFHYEMLVLFRNIKFNREIAYLPFSPYPIDSAPLYLAVENLSSINELLKKVMPKNVFTIKYDLCFEYLNPDRTYKIDRKLFHINHESVQPDETVFVPLCRDIDDIRASYRKRAKRMLKKNRSSVDVRIWGGEEQQLVSWFEIYRKTGEIDGFSTRSFSYIKKVLDMKNSTLLLSYVNEEMQGGIIVLFGLDVSIYLLGGSLKECGYSVSYSLQDEAIRLGKERGCKYYDLFGIGGKNSKHLESLNLFKTSFGGTVVQRCQTFDCPLKPLSYWIYSKAEMIRYYIYRK
jgi:lipid II:glycine glycyltransferase (peptidoglycan interpeptide bridge formation enzyme)